MSSMCLNCKKESGSIVELTCEHELCLDCAEKIKIPEGVPPLDAKFRICCPTCRKNTITLNIQNLVNRDNEKLLFVNMESSELSEQELEQPVNMEGPGKLSESKLRKMSYTERRSNIYAERKTPDINERGSKASHDSQRGNNRSRQGDNIFEVKCNVHKESLMFYCEQESMVMCMQCMYRHMKEQKNHNVCSISDALSTINRQNLENKSEAKKRIEEIDKNLAICKGNKSRIEQAYEIHEQLIQQEFKELEKLIKKKEQENKEYLERVFKKKEEEIIEQINDLNYIKSCLKEHFEFSIDNSTSQIYFFNAYNLLKTAISKYCINYKQIKKEEFFCFDKYASIEDFSSLLEKFYRPRTDGRESKTVRKEEQSNNPSRASEKNSNNQQLKIKQQFYEEAKKKLERLNKMENDHTNVKKKNEKEEYLNNFFIEDISKKEMDNSNIDKIPGSAMPSYRKSSASEYGDKKIIHKTLTPTRISNQVSTKSKKK